MVSGLVDASSIPVIKSPATILPRWDAATPLRNPHARSSAEPVT